MKNAWNYLKELKEEAVDRDKDRLNRALSIDAVGASSVIGYLFGVAPGIIGDVIDLAYGPAQTLYALKTYNDDLGFWQKAGITGLATTEEMLPGVFDVFPSVLATHTLAAINRTNKKYKGNLETEKLKEPLENLVEL